MTELLLLWLSAAVASPLGDVPARCDAGEVDACRDLAGWVHRRQALAEFDLAPSEPWRRLHLEAISLRVAMVEPCSELSAHVFPRACADACYKGDDTACEALGDDAPEQQADEQPDDSASELPGAERLDAQSRYELSKSCWDIEYGPSGERLCIYRDGAGIELSAWNDEHIARRALLENTDSVAMRTWGDGHWVVGSTEPEYVPRGYQNDLKAWTYLTDTSDELVHVRFEDACGRDIVVADGRFAVITGERCHLVRMYDIASGEPVGEPMSVASLPIETFAMEGRWLAVSERPEGGAQVSVWDTSTGRRAWSAKSRTDVAQVSPDGQFVYAETRNSGAILRRGSDDPWLEPAGPCRFTEDAVWCAPDRNDEPRLVRRYELRPQPGEPTTWEVPEAAQYRDDSFTVSSDGSRFAWGGHEVVLDGETKAAGQLDRYLDLQAIDGIERLSGRTRRVRGELGPEGARASISVLGDAPEEPRGYLPEHLVEIWPEEARWMLYPLPIALHEADEQGQFDVEVPAHRPVTISVRKGDKQGRVDLPIGIGDRTVALRLNEFREAPAGMPRPATDPECELIWASGDPIVERAGCIDVLGPLSVDLRDRIDRVEAVDGGWRLVIPAKLRIEVDVDAEHVWSSLVDSSGNTHAIRAFPHFSGVASGAAELYLRIDHGSYNPYDEDRFEWLQADIEVPVGDAELKAETRPWDRPFRELRVVDVDGHPIGGHIPEIADPIFDAYGGIDYATNMQGRVQVPTDDQGRAKLYWTSTDDAEPLPATYVPILKTFQAPRVPRVTVSHRDLQWWRDFDVKQNIRGRWKALDDGPSLDIGDLWNGNHYKMMALEPGNAIISVGPADRRAVFVDEDHMVLFERGVGRAFERAD